MFNRTFTVRGPEEIQEYRGFDCNSAGADFRLLPNGMIGHIDGYFYCTEEELLVALEYLAAYNREQYRRPRCSVNVLRVS